MHSSAVTLPPKDAEPVPSPVEVSSTSRSVVLAVVAVRIVALVDVVGHLSDATRELTSRLAALVAPRMELPSRTSAATYPHSKVGVESPTGEVEKVGGNARRPANADAAGTSRQSARQLRPDRGTRGLRRGHRRDD